MRTLADDRITLRMVSEPAGDSGLWQAECEGCGWTDPEKGWGCYTPGAINAARKHADKCTGEQGTLF